MIANDAFVACFGIVPSGDEDSLPALVRNAVRQGFAIVPVAAGQKTPICTLTARQAKAADSEVRVLAKAADERGWESKRHACGIGHALTDPVIADRVVKRLVKERGGINIGVEVGRSRMVMVDADSAAELAGFLDDWGTESGIDMTGRRPTVTSPGVRRVDSSGETQWVHKDGGHFWFTVPEGVDLASLPGQGTLRADSGWVVTWKDHQALVPPSVRAEGSYTITGQVEPAPDWLITRIEMAALSYVERRARQQERIRHDGDPIDRWSEATPWEQLLSEDGWTNTGLPDNCSCPIWTRPGDAAHLKSATAHELGCTKFDTVSGHGPMHLWTDNPPEFLADAVTVTGNRTLTKLQYVAWRDHNGDMPAAMRALELDFLGDDESSNEVEAMLDEFVRAQDAAPVLALESGVPVDQDPPGPTEVPVADEFADLRKDPRLMREVEQLHRRDQAKTWYDRLRNRAGRNDLKARIKAATDRLDRMPEDEQDVAWRIQDLWQQGQTVLLTAQYKAGKTTMVVNVIRSLVDGKPFLGQFEATPVARSVYVVNAEMTGRQFRRWLREAGIQNTEKVYALHIREAGAAAGDILDPATRELLIDELTEANAQVLILDPLNPLLSGSGVDENSSSEVARWFNALADLVERSPVEDVLLVHHFGHSGERGRGSSKFMDAPDAIWTYTKDYKAKHAAPDDTDDLLSEIDTTAEPRFLAAIGRDVELSKSRVDFDPNTRTLTMPVVGSGPSRGAELGRMEALQTEQVIGHITSFVLAHPGITTNALFVLVKGKKDRFRACLDEAVHRGLLIEEPGPNRSKKFTVSAGWDPVGPSGTGPTGQVGETRPAPYGAGSHLTHSPTDLGYQDQGPTQTGDSDGRGGES